MFSDHGELEAGFDLVNMVTFPNNSYVRVQVGRLDYQTPLGKELTIQQDKIEWHRSLSQVRNLHCFSTDKISHQSKVVLSVVMDPLILPANPPPPNFK